MGEEDNDTAALGDIQQAVKQDGIEVPFGESSGNTVKVITEKGKGLEEAFSDSNENVVETKLSLHQAMKHKMVLAHLILLSILLPKISSFPSLYSLSCLPLCQSL